MSNLVNLSASSPQPSDEQQLNTQQNYDRDRKTGPVNPDAHKLNSSVSSLSAAVEALLFISHKPLTVRQLAKFCSVGIRQLESALALLEEKYSPETSGIVILKVGNKYQLATSSQVKTTVEAFIKEELTGELTRPQLETLTIIAYRGPIKKTEIEKIRGVNCSLILRNLRIRGLVEVVSGEAEENLYNITLDFLRFLGLTSPSELPNYQKLRNHRNIEEIIKQSTTDA